MTSSIFSFRKQDSLYICTVQVDYTKALNHLCANINDKSFLPKIEEHFSKNKKGVENVEMAFFQPEYSMNMNSVDALYKKYNLQPNPYAQTTINYRNPSFCYDYDNFLLWKIEKNEYIRIDFFNHHDDFFISVDQKKSDDHTYNYQWYAGELIKS